MAVPWRGCPATSPSTWARPTPSSTPRGRGIVLNEPTVVALDTRSRDVLAIGDEAWQMIGRTPGLHRGRAPDAPGGHHRLRHHRADAPGAAAPGGRGPAQPAPGAHLRAVGHHRRRASGGEGGGPAGRAPSASYLIEQPMAAAIGAGLAIHEPIGLDGGRRRRRHLRDGGHLARRRGGPAGHPLRRLRPRRRHPDLRAHRARRGHRRAHGRGGQAGHRLGLPLRGRAAGRDPRPRGRPGMPKTVPPLARGDPRRGGGPGGPDRGGGGHTASATPRPSWPRTSSSRASTWSAAARCCGA